MSKLYVRRGESLVLPSPEGTAHGLFCLSPGTRYLREEWVDTLIERANKWLAHGLPMSVAIKGLRDGTIDRLGSFGCTYDDAGKEHQVLLDALPPEAVAVPKPDNAELRVHTAELRAVCQHMLDVITKVEEEKGD